MVSLTGAVVFNRVAKYIQIYQLKIKFILPVLENYATVGWARALPTVEVWENLNLKQKKL